MSSVNGGRTAMLIFLALSWGCEGGNAPPPESPSREEPGPGGARGRLVLIGGGLRSENLAVYEAVLGGRDGDGPLCILPPASGTPRASMEGYVDSFDAVGGPGTAEGILLSVDNRSDAESEAVAERLSGCSGFFFTGGVQSRITEVLLPDGETTPAFQTLWNRYQSGAVVSGSSAGAAIMSDPMIAGGGSGEALRWGITSREEGEGVWLAEGLGFLESGLVDQHFLARGRWARLLVGILGMEGDRLGLGIDENTALVVEADSAWVVGESGVLVLDARAATSEDGGNGGYGVRVHLLGAGDRLNLRTGAVRPDPAKIGVPEGEEPFADPDADLFAPWSLLRVLLELATAPDTRLTFHQDGQFLEIRKEPGFTALAPADPNNRTPPAGLFLGPFVMSVWAEG